MIDGKLYAEAAEMEETTIKQLKDKGEMIRL